MTERSKRVEDILEFLIQIKQVMQEVLEVLEREEHYEECADLLNEIKQTEDDIQYYKRLIEVAKYTGRTINHS